MLEFWNDFKNDSFTFTATVFIVLVIVAVILGLRYEPADACTVVLGQ